MRRFLGSLLTAITLTLILAVGCAADSLLPWDDQDMDGDGIRNGIDSDVDGDGEPNIYDLYPYDKWRT